MKRDEPIRVLLLANEFNSAQIMFGRPARAHLDIREVGSRVEFLRAIRDDGPDVVVVESNGIEGLPFGAVLDRAIGCLPEVPVVVLGADGEDGRDAIRYLEDGAADYLPVSHLARLPQVVRRLKRDRDLLASQSRLEAEAQRSHVAMLENQKLMAIGRLAGSIAHEINNPLESITNLLYLLRTEPNLSEQARQYLDLAEREMERVAQISKQTLNFYRETRTAMRVRPSDLLDEVVSLYSRRIEERRIEVVRQYKSEATLLAFPGELRQVLSNLVTNALEASPVGGRLTLRIHAARKWSDEGIRGIRIVVADNGSGISPETRQKLGQLFYTTKGQRGTGMGLWVTRAIVRRYGGELQLYTSTREGRSGTVFSVFMPTNLRPQRVVRSGESVDPGDGEPLRRGSRLAGGKPHSAQVIGAETPRRREFRRRATPLAAG